MANYFLDSAKLTREQVAEILKLWGEGASKYALSIHFNVSISTITYHLRKHGVSREPVKKLKRTITPRISPPPRVGPPVATLNPRAPEHIKLPEDKPMLCGSCLKNLAVPYLVDGKLIGYSNCTWCQERRSYRRTVEPRQETYFAPEEIEEIPLAGDEPKVRPVLENDLEEGDLTDGDL